MDILQYFEVVSAKDGVLHFQNKGFFSESVMAEIAEEYVKQLKNAIDSMGGPFVVLADMSTFRAPSEVAKKVMAKCMKYAVEHEMIKAVEVMPSAITKLAIKQAAQHSGEDDFRIVVSSLEEAYEVIKGFK